MISSNINFQSPMDHGSRGSKRSHENTIAKHSFFDLSIYCRLSMGVKDLVAKATGCPLWRRTAWRRTSLASHSWDIAGITLYGYLFFHIIIPKYRMTRYQLLNAFNGCIMFRHPTPNCILISKMTEWFAYIRNMRQKLNAK